MKKCSVEGCTNPYKSKGLCLTHYMRKRRYGRVELIRRENGTGSISHGYILITNDWGRKAQHTLVAEKALGKKLPKGVVVHHVDLNRKNNDPKNLVICPSQAYHLLLHKRMRDRDRNERTCKPYA